MPKAINIKWETDGYDVELPTEDDYVTPEMKAMLQNLADLANGCSDEIWDDDDENGTAGILSLCDKLADKIDKYLDN